MKIIIGATGAIAALLVLMDCHAAMSAPATSHPLPGAEIRRNFIHGNNRIILIYSVERLNDADRLHKMMGTGSWYVPKTAIRNFQITFDKKQVNIPLSAISDIYDPNEIRIDFRKGHYCVDVIGGDGAESFETRIWFDSRHVFARESGDIGFVAPSERSSYRLIEGP